MPRFESPPLSGEPIVETSPPSNNDSTANEADHGAGVIDFQKEAEKRRAEQKDRADAWKSLSSTERMIVYEEMTPSKRAMLTANERRVLREGREKFFASLSDDEKRAVFDDLSTDERADLTPAEALALVVSQKEHSAPSKEADTKFDRTTLWKNFSAFERAVIYEDMDVEARAKLTANERRILIEDRAKFFSTLSDEEKWVVVEDMSDDELKKLTTAERLALVPTEVSESVAAIEDAPVPAPLSMPTSAPVQETTQLPEKAPDSFLWRLRKNPVARAFMKAAVIASTFVALHGAVAKSRGLDIEDGATVITHKEKRRSRPAPEVKMDDTAVVIASQDIETTMRDGMPEWSPAEQQAFKAMPLMSRFLLIHKDLPEVRWATASARGNIESYPLIAARVEKEFPHSNMLWEYTDFTVAQAKELFPRMILPEEAIKKYDVLVQAIEAQVGLAKARQFGEELLATLPDDSAFAKHVAGSSIMRAEVREWLKPSLKNSFYFDQKSGKMLVVREMVDGHRVILDSGSANGGRSDAAEKQTGSDAHQFVVTPPGTYTLGAPDTHKKSISYQTSWVTDGAPLRLTSDGKDVEYKDVDGAWKRLTGEDAVFMGTKPFQKGGNHTLIFSATVRDEQTGEEQPPQPITLAMLKEAKEKLRDAGIDTSSSDIPSVWRWNDFGPLVLPIIKDGKPTRFYVHTSPKTDKFTGSTHGCISVYSPEVLQQLQSHIKAGSKIIVGPTFSDRTSDSTYHSS